MSDDSGKDDRSMSEILASIRKIVTEEETTRRETEGRSAEGDADVLELTETMRAEPTSGACSDEDQDDPTESPFLELGDEAARRAEGAALRGAEDVAAAEIEAIVRRVIREELKGPIGIEISRKVKAVIREEVRRILAEDEPLI